MKNSRSFWLVMLVTVSLVGLVGCGGDGDAEPGNQIKFDGKTIKFTSAAIESELDIDDELGEYSSHVFFFTSEGLTMSETGNLSGSGDMVVLELFSTSTTHLVEGTYTLGLNSGIGDVNFFEIYSNLTSSSLGKLYFAYRGTVKVSKIAENRYSLTFDFDIFTSQSTSQEEEFVAGKIKGNYKGTVNVITDNGPAKLSSERFKKGKKSFTWQ